jgi:hypothetical protein
MSRVKMVASNGDLSINGMDDLRIPPLGRLLLPEYFYSHARRIHLKHGNQLQHPTSV